MLTLTKNIIKEIRSLEQRRGRREQQSWLAEGNRMVEDLLDTRAFACRRLIATEAWWNENRQYASLADECYLVTRAEMDRASLLQTPQEVMAVFALPTTSKAINKKSGQPTTGTSLQILLDEVQDPGNVGTIIRTADWFGVRDIYCAPGTADCFSPKVVQATMSALARVSVHYFETKEEVTTWLKQQSCPIYGTFLEGTDIYNTPLSSSAILVMGNEGRGVSTEVAAMVTDKLLIPDFSDNGAHVESLNVAIATAICLSEIKAHPSN